MDPEQKPPLDQIKDTYNIDAVNEENETKDNFFQRKLKELEEMLKAKSALTINTQPGTSTPHKPTKPRLPKTGSPDPFEL